jgi:hypothetical protein
VFLVYSPVADQAKGNDPRCFLYSPVADQAKGVSCIFTSGGSCHVCQIVHVGKPNQKIPSASLQNIPALGQPFSRVLVDCV